jgi:hypothetical protein
MFLLKKPIDRNRGDKGLADTTPSLEIEGLFELGQ